MKVRIIQTPQQHYVFLNSRLLAGPSIVNARFVPSSFRIQSKRPLVKTSPNWSKRPPKTGKNVRMVKNVGQNVPKMIFILCNFRHNLDCFNESVLDIMLVVPVFVALRFLSTLWPILQLFAHHIQDKLAVSFDSSSIGLISYKCFLTIDAKYSFVKAYNEENSIF